MKIYLILLIFILAGFGFNAYAQADNPLHARNFAELLAWLARAIFWLAVIILPLGIIAGGILYLTSAANPDNVALAKKVILYCSVILGTVVMIKLLVTYFGGGLTFSR